jgi:choline monooxygenase
MSEDQALDQVKALIGEAGFRQAFAPIEEASGLPNAAYRSEDWLRLEQERVFARSWVFAGAEAEIPAPGQMKPVEIGGSPLVLVRGKDGAVRAFHNVCRHRGAKLVTAPCKKALITCPYHAWSYGLDGKLRSRPHFGGPGETDSFDNGGGPLLDLLEVRCTSWNGCVFVNISGDAPPVETWLTPLTARTEGYDYSAIRWAGKLEFDVRANWKLVYENYMEGYHVFNVHPRLIKFAPMNVRWSGRWCDHVFYNDYLFPKTEEGRGANLPHYPDLPEADSRRGLWFLAFPQFAAEVYPDQFTVLASYPLAPDRTHEELHVFLIGEAASSEAYQEARQALFRMWDELNREDLGVLELLQEGRRSAAYDGGRLSPHWEGPIHEFGRRVIEAITRT